MEKIIVSRTDGEVIVTLLPHKDGSGWSFVNLTKGHICPCKFDSKKAGIQDLDSKPNVISYKMMEQKNQTNADRIRSMSDFELAKEIENSLSGIEIPNPKNIDYFDCILEWLQQPAEDEA